MFSFFIPWDFYITTLFIWIVRTLKQSWTDKGENSSPVLKNWGRGNFLDEREISLLTTRSRQ